MDPRLARERRLLTSRWLVALVVPCQQMNQRRLSIVSRDSVGCNVFMMRGYMYDLLQGLRRLKFQAVRQVDMRSAETTPVDSGFWSHVGHSAVFLVVPGGLKL
ncbi:uncharacterized protein EDB91DRAFT_103320 [Suillus paluster]|uniref:uncharacterized protein n=1 Tax=Suillus paluster TaxID=48578 RepID=UPI001B87CE31|nr:uncharacterized protein EDB91DRAFT_103320 [Suillus paluster]KAG1746601.1 hypothetical protein EDB91DRAFT_103320 [Suillus paluster]